jgi:sugar/nucleoside kinase (ribokinase family)
MDYWMTGAKRESLIRLLGRVDGVLVDHGEARLLSGLSRLTEAVRWIADRGPRFVVLKRGDCGALALLAGEWFWTPPYPEADVRDPTGAGDSFAGGLLGGLARWGTEGAGLRRALVVGAATASRAIEGFGAEPLAELELSEILERARLVRDMGCFPRPDPALDGESSAP